MTNQSTLTDLTELVAPPKRPLRCSDERNWQKLNQSIQFPFPHAFLEYGKIYGTGEMEVAGYVLQIANPLDPKYSKWAKSQCDVMRTRGDGPELRKTRFHPETDGVFPFATDLCGDLVFFTRSGTIVSCPTDPNILIPYEYHLIGFLHGLFSGTLSPKYFPKSQTREKTAEFRKSAWMG